jgi:hypothetical protein
VQPVIATGEVEDVIVPETTMCATQAIYDMTRGLICAHFSGIDVVAVDGHVYPAAAARFGQR